jgi:hsp70-interacting protein
MMTNNSNPWAWLGLLKWSLAYSDGTKPTDHQQMSVEDKAFLEAVMKEGIIDEHERLKEILKQVTSHIETWKVDKATQEQEYEVEKLLEELRFIVEQIDYARAFAGLKGLPFLLGCIQETDSIPSSTRLMCLSLICTLCQHNPPLQKELLELGSLKILSDLFFHSVDIEQAQSSGYQAKIMQAISANVRSHDLAEMVFCQLEQAPPLLLDGVAKQASTSLRKRALFFLRALITSDSSTPERVRLFNSSIMTVIDSILMDDEEGDAELREMSLALIIQLLEQAKSIDGILTRRDALVAVSVARVAALRKLTGDEKDYATVELREWEDLLTLLVQAVPDSAEPTAPAALMIGEPIQTLGQ